jgi:hypothetical protein
MNARSLDTVNHAIMPVVGDSRVGGVIGFACFWLAGVYVLLKIAPTFYELSMLFLILTVLLMPLAYKYVRHDLDIFEPLVFANLALASMFLGRPIFDLSTNTWLHDWFATSFDARPGFDAMLFYALLGIAALQLGYMSAVPQKVAQKLPLYPREVDTNRMIAIAWAMFLLGAVLFEEYVRQSGGIAFLKEYLTSRSLDSGYSLKAASGYLFIGPLFWPPAGMLALSAWFVTKKLKHLLLSAFFLYCFFVTMLGGVGRTYTIQGLLGIAAIGYVGRGKRPSILLVLPIAIVMLLFLVYDREARLANSFADKEVVAQRLSEHPLDALATIWSEDDAAMCDYFSLIVANVPSRMGYATGSTVEDILLRAYPRFLSPGNKKPDERTVYIFKMLFPAVFYEYVSGAAPSLIGDLYVDHGRLSIVVYMFCFGVILGVPGEWMKSSNRAIPAQLLFVAMPAYTISLMRGGVPAFVEYLAITAVPVLLLSAYAYRRRSYCLSESEEAGLQFRAWL